MTKLGRVVSIIIGFFKKSLVASTAQSPPPPHFPLQRDGFPRHEILTRNLAFTVELTEIIISLGSPSPRFGFYAVTPS